MNKRDRVLVACATALLAGSALAVASAVWDLGPLSPDTALRRTPGLVLESLTDTRTMGWPAETGDRGAVLEQAQTLATVPPPAFDAAAAMADIRALAAFGPRGGGSDAEAQAAEFLRGRLTAIGLKPRVDTFTLTDGSTSRNVIARVEGSSADVFVLGAHYDSKPPSPGANDNASGCAVLLDIARILSGAPVVPTVEFVFYGAEERIDADPDHHHYGSRYRVSQMTAGERDRVAGMISVDMIGYGSELNSLTMGVGPQTLSDALLAHAKAQGISMGYRKDRARTGSSDHEPYERAGMPAACVSARTDPTYHTEADVASHVSSMKVAAAGRLVLDFVWSLDTGSLGEISKRD